MTRIDANEENRIKKDTTEDTEVKDDWEMLRMRAWSGLGCGVRRTCGRIAASVCSVINPALPAALET